MTLPVVFTANGPSGYNLTKSLRFRSSASAYLNRTPASAGSRTTWTISAWVKRGALSTRMDLFSNDSTNTAIQFLSGDYLGMEFYNGAGADYYIYSSAVYRDPSSWYHIVSVWDTTNATASDRQRLYVNGNRITSFYASGNTIPLNAQSQWNTATSHSIGRSGSGSYYFDGEMTEINFIDGQALTPSSFGSTNSLTGVWQPAKYTGTYGTNGFYLPFTNTTSTTTLGYDFSGNSNNWTTNNISLTSGSTYDSMTDVPTLTSATVANYCVLNPLNNPGGGTIVDGNLGATTASTGFGRNSGTMAISSGKWYWEVVFTNLTADGVVGIGGASEFTSTYPGGTATSYGYIASNGNKSNNGSGVAYGATWTTNDVMGIALDLDGGTLTFYKNNTSQGTAYSGLSGSFVPAISDAGSGSSVFNVNFGQRPFTYTPPTGFKALNTYNLPTSTIVKGNTVMDATTYTGTGSSYSVTNTAGFKPDFVWVKERSQIQDHALFDSVRGATKQLSSNTTGAEATYANSLSAFNSNGFTVVSDAVVNSSGQTYVGWQWQAGQGTTSSNTNGSITSTVSVNATAGFSIVSYTGTGANATVGHGLGVAPSMIITKVRSTTNGWVSWHTSLGGADKYIVLSNTNGTQTDSTVWNNTLPTSSVFSIGASANTNISSATYVAYCWAQIAGFSLFGSYTGNGSTDGTFVYTGFQPKFVIVKETSSTNSWVMVDSVRNPYNSVSTELYPNLSNAESTDYAFNFLSNGFKLTATSSNTNASGQTYIYMAFASNPFKNSLAF